MMAARKHILCLLLVVLSVTLSIASEGDQNPAYRSCAEDCSKSGCLGQTCLPNCHDTRDGAIVDGGHSKIFKEFLDLAWMKWDCKSECRYQCMKVVELERESLGHSPVKYHGKWPFARVLKLQEPASVAFSVLNFVVHLHGLVSFYILVHYKLPLRSSQNSKRPFYEYASLWTIHGCLSMNSWFWSAVFHARDNTITEKLDYSCAVILLGYTLVLSIIRTLKLTLEAAQVMVAAPILAFISTHILYLNFYNFDFSLNMKVCVVMGVIQLFLWTGWAGICRHPAKIKLWTVLLGTTLALLLEVFDFPPLWFTFDAHSLWHAVTVPLTYLWWSFIKDDAYTRTSAILSKVTAAEKVEAKKVQ